MKINDIKDYINRLQKGELHVHFNGLVSTDIIIKVIKDESIKLPDYIDLKNDLIIKSPVNNLREYIKPWEILRQIPNKKHSLRIMMLNAFQNLELQNTKFVEIRNSIIYLAHINDISVYEAMKWFLDELEYASNKYKIKAGLILTISRGDYCLDNLNVLLKAYEKLGKPSSIVGLDLAGDEDIEILDDVSKAFKNAKNKYDLKITIHAGETGNNENIIKAIDLFEADRIGHGTAAGKSLEVMNYLKEKNICVEVCLISNRLTRAVNKDENHLIINFIENEVPFVLSTDNPSIHNKTLNDDYFEFYKETKRIDILNKMYDSQKKFTFLKGIE